MALSLAEDDRDDGEEDVEQSRKITTEKAEEMESRRGYRPARMSLRHEELSWLASDAQTLLRGFLPIPREHLPSNSP